MQRPEQGTWQITEIVDFHVLDAQLMDTNVTISNLDTSPLPSASRNCEESVFGSGPDGSVIGITTVPGAGTQDSADRAKPVILFLNAGVLHRVGPHRLHVIAARQFASVGFAGMRLDLSGIGDSPPLRADLTFRASAVTDIRAAMDSMANKYQSSSFVLFGLCSGADNAIACALQDPRVTGLVLIDPPAYATYRSRLRSAWEKFNRAQGLGEKLRLFTGVIGNRRRAQLQQATQGRQAPRPGDFRQWMTSLHDRGARLLCVYSGGYGVRYNKAGQIFEALPALRGKLEEVFLPSANHVFTESTQRGMLVDHVQRWLIRHFG